MKECVSTIENLDESNFKSLINHVFPVTRSLSRALAIVSPIVKKGRPARIRARRRTTINLGQQPVRRTSRRVKSSPSISRSEPIYYCVCHGPDIGTLMVKCDSSKCSIQWYHVACLNETIDYDLEWFCNLCR